MKKYILAALMMIAGLPLFSQNQFKAVVKDKGTNEPVIGATAYISSLNAGGSADKDGLVILSKIPSGKYTIAFSMVGYSGQELTLDFPLKTDSLFTVMLQPAALELDGVTIVASTRSSRNINNIPTRIETIASGELEEKSVMQPANIRMLLTESTGIQVQQTSQVSASASIRIQGLDGKYTQMLQDGFPLYSGYAGGLSLLQIPPLNLRRVEVIKGSTSTLYGGGAIAGLINLITKEPKEKREISFLVNGNTSKALDLSAFYSEKYGKTGLVLYTTGNFQKAYDAAGNGFSDIPQSKRFTFNPDFFWYIDKSSTFNLGLNAGIETRKGGDMEVLKGHTDAEHQFYELNKSGRYSTHAKYTKIFGNNATLMVKNSLAYFGRDIERNNYGFSGKQYSVFSEASYMLPKENTEWIFGLSHVADNFKQPDATMDKLNYTNSVIGVFAQNNYNITQKIIAESGIRFDYTNRNDFFALPRLSLLYKFNPRWSSRIGGGLGYKVPTIFSEESEERAFQGIQPLDFSMLKPEKSYGANADVNYKTTIGSEWFFSINQMFYYTVITKPLVLNEVGNTGNYAFVNANGNIDTRGFETNIKLRYDDISCYLGYTFTDAVRKFDGGSSFNPLTSKHRINANLMYEIEDKLRLSYELFYYSPQRLTSGEQVRGYWIMGASAEYTIKALSLFANFENFTDTRQSRWGAMYTGSRLNPQFNEIYAPTDGFIANAGFRISF